MQPARPQLRGRRPGIVARGLLGPGLMLSHAPAGGAFRCSCRRTARRRTGRRATSRARTPHRWPRMHAPPAPARARSWPARRQTAIADVHVAGSMGAVLSVQLHDAPYVTCYILYNRLQVFGVAGRWRAACACARQALSSAKAPRVRTRSSTARAREPQITYLSHQQRGASMVSDSRENAAYYRIAEHYRFVLRTLFDCFEYPRVIILEVGRPRPPHPPLRHHRTRAWGGRRMATAPGCAWTGRTCALRPGRVCPALALPAYCGAG
jgi:hypothetical protein